MKLLKVLLVVGWLFVAMVPAHAHSELTQSTPAADDKVGKPPEEISISYSEVPVAQSRVVVRDGCGNDVAGSREVEDHDLIVSLNGGQPGLWRVKYDVISAEDGHATGGSYSFTVNGEKDCSAAAPDDGGDDEESESSGPGAGVLIPIAIGGAVLIGLALFLRGRST